MKGSDIESLEEFQNLTLTDSSEDNDKENLSARNTELTVAIHQLRKEFGIKETETGFSWRDVRLGVEGKELLPEALDQKFSDLCIVYSLLGLFYFQQALLKARNDKVKDLRPSKFYLQRMFYSLEDRCIQQFLQLLTRTNIAADDEYDSTGNRLTRGPLKKKFSIDWSYNISSDDPEMVKKTQRAIKRFGGVIVELVVTEEDETPITEESPQKGVLRTTGPKRKRKKNYGEHLDLGHAIFGYGWRYDDDGNLILKYLNSYGPDVGDKGHEELSNLKQINHVYVPQLCFNELGF